MTEARGTGTKEAFGFWLLVAPSLLLLVFVFAWTIAGVVRMSFNGWTPPSFYVEDIVLDHYVKLATDPLIREAAFNTVILAGMRLRFCSTCSMASGIPCPRMALEP